jgi:yeast amino acid transporter
MGGDMVIVSAGEAQNPREDVPPATRFMYIVIFCLYIVGSLLVGLNVNYLEPDLLHPWRLVNEHGPGSAFIIALKYTSIEVLPSFLNACFLISAYTAASVSPNPRAGRD